MTNLTTNPEFSKNQVFIYNEQPIAFQLGNGVMINATQMAKPFGKQPYEYLRLPTTAELIKAITGKSRICENQLVTIRQGSPENGGGTWFHEDIAIDFAQWLSVDLRLWCNDRLRELFKYGITATSTAIESIISDPDSVIQILEALKKERAEKERLTIQANIQQKELQEAAPKIKYYNEVIDGSTLITTNKIALDFGMSAIKLNRILCEKRIQYREGETYLLFSKYRDKGYAFLKPHPYVDSLGRQQTVQHLYWTEKGRQFIHQLLSN